MDSERMMWVGALRDTAKKYKLPWGRTFFDQDECEICRLAEELCERGSVCGNCVFHAVKCGQQKSYIDAKDDYFLHISEIGTALKDVKDGDTFDIPETFNIRSEELETLADIIEHTVQDCEFREFVEEYTYAYELT